MVTVNYFRTFGVVPSPGRDFADSEERPGNGPAPVTPSLPAVCSPVRAGH